MSARIDQSHESLAPVADLPWNPYNPFMPFVYMLRCRDGSFYTGSTTDLARRLKQHHLGRASKYTRSRLPVTLCWVREVDTWSTALSEEHRVKTFTHAQKLALIVNAKTQEHHRS